MRFYGKVGYRTTVEDPEGSGTFVKQITEFSYFGDVYQNIATTLDDDKVNSDISVRNRIEIVADPHALANFMNIVYVEWEGVRWKPASVEVQRPRLILTPGEVYRGPVPVP